LRVDCPAPVAMQHKASLNSFEIELRLSRATTQEFRAANSRSLMVLGGRRRAALFGSIRQRSALIKKLLARGFHKVMLHFS
jgi:hypothetical protein